MIRLGLAALAALSLVACSNGASFGITPKEDNFSSSILYNNKVDIIWLVDDSSSMKGPQDKLIAQVEDMVTQLNSLKMDYRMVVTTTSVGSNKGGGKYVGSPAVLTSSTGNLAQTLKARLAQGEAGYDMEQGILSLQNLLSNDFINSPAGQGFHREESLLLINILSDEDDQSPGSAASVVQSLRSRLDQLKAPFRPNVGGWLVNFIGVKDTTCKDPFGVSHIGYRYLDLVNASGGKSFSICDVKLQDAVKGLQARVLEIITDYPLTTVPNLSTVRVVRNGVVIPRSNVNGWDYIPSLNVIRFYGTAIPSSDAAVTVDYTPASAS